MVVVDTLTVEVEADIKDLDSNLDKWAKSLDNFNKKGKKTNEEVKKTVKTLDSMNSELTELKRKLWGVEIWSREFKRLSKEIKKSETNIRKASKGMTETLWGLKGTILKAFWVTAVINFSRKIVDLASDLEETTSKFNVIFWWLEDKAKLTFDTIAESAGRSRLDVKKWGAELGDVLKPLWFTTQEALNLSWELTKLAIDVASFNNVSDTQAINAFRSAITWERESLKSLGIVINEADVKTEAFTSWIAKAGTQLTKTQKAQATYNLLLKNTTDAHGDAERTATSYANITKRLEWRLKDLGATIWTKLLPLFSKVVNITLSIIDKTVEYGKQIWFLILAIWTLVWAKWLFALFTILTRLIPVIRWVAVVNALLTWSVWLATFSMRAFVISAAPMLWTLALITSALWGATQAYKAYSKALELIDSTDKMVESQENMIKVLDKWVNKRKENIAELKKANEELTKSDDENAKKQIEINNKKIEANKKFLNANLKLQVWDRWPADNQEQMHKLQKEGISLMKEAEIQQKKLWWVVQTGWSANIETLDTINAWLSEMNAELWGLELWSKAFNDLQREIWLAEGKVKKYTDTQTGSSDKQKKEIERTAKALEDAVKNQVKDLEWLKEEWEKAYWDINEEIINQWEKVEWLQIEYDNLEDKISDVWTKWKADIKKISDAIDELNNKLKEVESWGQLDLWEREVEIKNELFEIQQEITKNELDREWVLSWFLQSKLAIEKEIRDLKSKKRDVRWSWEDASRVKEILAQEIADKKLLLGEVRKRRISVEQIELLEKEKALNAELDILLQNQTAEWFLESEIELNKTKTEKILDSIQAKKDELIADKVILEEKKVIEQAKLDKELEDLQILSDAKKLEKETEAETLAELIDTKNILEQNYLDAFGVRITEEGTKVDKLTKKYLALARAKAKAWYSWSVLGTASSLVTQPKQEFDTRQSKDVQTKTYNQYWDNIIHEKSDKNEILNDFNSQINP